MTRECDMDESTNVATDEVQAVGQGDVEVNSSLEVDDDEPDLGDALRGIAIN